MWNPTHEWKHQSWKTQQIFASWEQIAQKQDQGIGKRTSGRKKEIRSQKEGE